MDNNILFSKIVATPNLNSWSQAYNAGKLFAVLSLEKTTDNPEVESLNMVGKKYLERLEQEFFVIEAKNLESIKNAIKVVFSEKNEGVDISFALGAVVDNILYLFGFGNSKIYIRRNGNTGVLLEGHDSSENLSSSSGFLQEEDLIVLATKGFSEIITQEDLNVSFTNSDPSEITESLAPKIHKSEDGKISAIVIKYLTLHTVKLVEDPTLATEIEKNEEEQRIVAKSKSPYVEKLWSLARRVKRHDFKFKSYKNIYLFAAIAIFGILIFSVVVAVQQQRNAKIKALFDQVYPQAQKKYDEAKSLAGMSKNFAKDAYLAAEKILKENLASFPPKSNEETKTKELLTKIADGLSTVSPVDKSGLDRSKLKVMVENGSGKEGVAAKGSSFLKDLGYNVVDTGNADNYDYEGATIKIKKEQEKYINLLKQDLAKDYIVTKTSSDLSPDSPSDAIIIIGK